ncbi:hypothetical protein [Rhizohabitans arisaemae]|uniref:hypothetical protein n=1 Tax=Rhizohabitans arisaemae TaxID=2720610 RepID=UPI0024B09AC5|nr:hypothetical protein [Rhizohabitans arisaemae]
MTGEVAGLIAERVTTCPDVVGLSGGPYGTVATYLPGEMVSGVAVRDDEVEIHIVARYGRPLAEIAESVRGAVADLTGDLPVNVTVDDVRTESELQGET